MPVAGWRDRAVDGVMVNMPVLAPTASVKWILHTLDPRTDDAASPAHGHVALQAAEAHLRSILADRARRDDRHRRARAIQSFSAAAERLFGYTAERGRRARTSAC